MLEKESAKHNSKLLPVCEENGVYNFFLKADSRVTVAPLEDETECPDKLSKGQLIQLIEKLKKEQEEKPGFTRQP